MRKRTLLDLQTLLNGQLKFFWKKITENVLFIYFFTFISKSSSHSNSKYQQYWSTADYSHWLGLSGSEAATGGVL